VHKVSKTQISFGKNSQLPREEKPTTEKNPGQMLFDSYKMRIEFG